MKLTFEQIRKKCEPMKHLLVDEDGDEFLFLGFNREDELVTEERGFGSKAWEEYEIENWTIKEYKPTRKINAWEFKIKCPHCGGGRYERERSPYGTTKCLCCNFADKSYVWDKLRAEALLDLIKEQHPDLEIEVEL